MKNIFGLIISLLLFSSFTNQAEVYKIDLNRSKIEWIGRKITGAHKGEIKLNEGQLNFKDRKLMGGVFKMDMNSISITDLSGSSATKLLGHLKSDDFFSTDKNPTSRFEITNVEQKDNDSVVITGKLTIKGITNTLTFPASIKQKNKMLVAIANNVKVDRSKYDVRYGSDNFFAGLGDKAIDNNFELNILILAKKK